MSTRYGLRLLLVAACLCAPGCSFTARSNRPTRPKPPPAGTGSETPPPADHDLIELQRELSLYSD